jgi:hypothetical protein
MVLLPFTRANSQHMILARLQRDWGFAFAIASESLAAGCWLAKSYSQLSASLTSQFRN